jgi:benzoyl-CoA 2,3-dioxygenase component B
MPDGTQIDYDGLIPNNVGLADDLRVRKALETWHPGYIDWWKTMGPEGFQASSVFLRTAVGVGSEGWAKFGFVRMPEYRWGVLLAPAVEGRTIPFGAHKGEPAGRKSPANIAPCCAACL